MNTNILKAYLPKSLLIAATVCASGAMFVACDDVAPEDRYTPVEKPTVARRVLVQEFTGQGCINCPAGAATVHALQEQNPGSIIAVNMHPENTQYTRPLGGLMLTSPISTAWFQTYKPSMLPAAVVDGAEANTSVPTWTDAILSALEVPSSVDLSISSDYNSSTRELTVSYTASFTDSYPAPLSINLWVTEDGIVGPQYNGSNIMREYVHNHVLRASLTGDWGVEIAKGFAFGDEYSGSFTITLSDKWVADNCNVVGFVMNASRSVEQSAETKLVP